MSAGETSAGETSAGETSSADSRERTSQVRRQRIIGTRIIGTRIIGTRRAVVLVLCAALLLVAVATGVVVASRVVAHNGAVEQARTELREQAGSTVAAVFTVHSATWQTDRARARSLVAGDFAEGFAAQLGRAPDGGVTAVEWRPGDVAVSNAQTDSGTVLMTATVTTTRTDAAPVTEKRTVSASFAEIDGRWLVTGVEVLA